MRSAVFTRRNSTDKSRMVDLSFHMVPTVAAEWSVLTRTATAKSGFTSFWIAIQITQN